jgi:HSP20 family molecular chaperone IbpA
MTTKLITTTSPFGALRGFGQLPALFNEHWLHDALSSFDKWDKAFDLQGVHYPYDISFIKTKEGTPTEYYLDIALAGILKEDIKLSVKDQHLIVDVKPSFDRLSQDKCSWLKTGISYRDTKLQFQLGKDADYNNISSSFKNGLLRVTIPVKQTKVTDITINVD